MDYGSGVMERISICYMKYMNNRCGFYAVLGVEVKIKH